MVNELSELQNKQVVLDVTSQYVYLGKLVNIDTHYMTLEEADVHDLRDANSTRELYVLEARRHGINVNRQRVHIRLEQIVSLSALDKVQV
ncbi:hypothetical protein MNBD_PLANCTO02-1986 [hydrothermal vent metagenome]|uniref:LSM domain-containing protein n=1 Tax=hydrothermal vent metagenome TaxID=652676 RepID=A0A3B1D334_9ZZZZ